MRNEPQPLSMTARGGNRMDRITLNTDIVRWILSSIISLMQQVNNGLAYAAAGHLDAEQGRYGGGDVGHVHFGTSPAGLHAPAHEQ